MLTFFCLENSIGFFNIFLHPFGNSYFFHLQLQERLIDSFWKLVLVMQIKEGRLNVTLLYSRSLIENSPIKRSRSKSEQRPPPIKNTPKVFCLAFVWVLLKGTSLQYSAVNVTWTCARHVNHCYGDFVWMTWTFFCATIWLKSSSTRNLSSFGSVVLEKSPKNHLFFTFSENPPK